MVNGKAIEPGEISLYKEEAFVYYQNIGYLK